MRTFTHPARVAALALPVLLVASAGCDLAMADFKQKETAEWRKTYQLQPGGHVEIANVNGKIDVQAGSGNDVQVVAVKTARANSSDAARAALSRVEIRETVSPDAVRLDTQLQRGNSFFGGTNLSVDYTVKVPAGAEVKFTSVNGAIELNGLKGRVNAETTNGAIKAHDVAGALDANTTNGAIDVDLAELTGDVKLECTNGGITVRVASTAKATISARVLNGGIDVSGLSIDSSESSRRRLEGRLNGGGPRLDLESTNGKITLSSK